MDAAVRLVTQLPLEQIWREGSITGPRLRTLDAEEIVQLLRAGIVEFVVAGVGRMLRWVSATDAYSFWKTEIKPQLATNDLGIQPDQFPDEYCYLASEWPSANPGAHLVLLERYH